MKKRNQAQSKIHIRALRLIFIAGKNWQQLISEAYAPRGQNPKPEKGVWPAGGHVVGHLITSLQCVYCPKSDYTIRQKSSTKSEQPFLLRLSQLQSKDLDNELGCQPKT